VGIAGQYIFLAHDQQLRILRTLDLVPAVEGRSLMDLRRQARLVVGEQSFLVSEDVAPARLGLQLIELFE
jgi:hypothetical protein